MSDFRDPGETGLEITRRGYDRDQVDALLASLRARVEELEEQLDETESGSGDGSFPAAVNAELERVTADVDAVVAAAREAAEGLRRRAASEAARWREEADSDARRWRSEAESEAASLRAETQSAVERLRAEAAEEADKKKSEADVYVARVREEADTYAQQTRAVAESEAAQVRQEAATDAGQWREAAEKDTARVREEADAYSERLHKDADAYAGQIREEAEHEVATMRSSAEQFAADTRQSATSDAERWRAEAQETATALRSEAEAFSEETRRAATADATAARTDAEVEGDGVRRAADEYAAAVRSEAVAAAENLRASVWEEAQIAVEQITREVAARHQQAEDQALALIADGEQQSHRLTSQARKGSEEMRRSARMEADRMIGDAEARRDEIIETANRAAATAQERAQALERRRDELMGQLEKAQAAMRSLEEELETRQESFRELTPGQSTVRVVPPQSEEPVELEGVRIIAPPVSPLAGKPVTAEEIMDEVRTLREQRNTAATEPSDADDEKPTEDQNSGVPPVEPPLPDQLHATPVTVAEEPESPEIDSLFANLRGDDESAEPVPEAAAGIDPDELRERLLLPGQNRAVRQAKRLLTDQQNLALERLRVQGDDWNPESHALEEPFSALMTELAIESARSGYLAASDLGIRTDPPPEIEKSVAEPFIAELASALVDEVQGVLDAGRAADDSPRTIAAAVSRVYRAWRTDSIEVRLRGISARIYGDALQAALTEAGIENGEWALGGSYAERAS